MLKWSDVFDNNKATASNSGSISRLKEGPQELLRKSPPSYMRPTLVEAPPECRAEVPVQIPPPLASVVPTRQKSGQAQPKTEECAKLFGDGSWLEVLLQDSSWSRNSRDEIVEVVDLSQRQSGQNDII